MTNAPLITEIWVYLSGTPLLSLFITLVSYQIGLMLYQKSKLNPLCNPVGIAVLLVVLMIQAINMPYEEYFKGAQFVHFLLGSATVSLAIPIYRGYASLKKRIWPLMLSVVCGGIVSIVSAVTLAKLLGANDTIIGAFYAKSVTAPIAMGIAQSVGVSPTLTAIFAITTGILGAILGRYIFDFLKMKIWWQRGFAIGVGAHGIGTSRAFSVNPEAGAYASLAMGLHGILGAVLIPLGFKLFN